MIAGNYLFELKKFEYVESLSEETNCFSAVLFVNGRAFADCRNSGQGEMTHIRVYPEHRELGRIIEAFLKTQPKIKPEGYDFAMSVLVGQGTVTQSPHKPDMSKIRFI